MVPVVIKTNKERSNYLWKSFLLSVVIGARVFWKNYSKNSARANYNFKITHLKMFSLKLLFLHLRFFFLLPLDDAWTPHSSNDIFAGIQNKTRAVVYAGHIWRTRTWLGWGGRRRRRRRKRTRKPWLQIKPSDDWRQQGDRAEVWMNDCFLLRFESPHRILSTLLTDPSNI